jgi:O-acetylhomoserine (thiol)-lyase
MSNNQPGFNTLAIHAGAQPDPATGARATPIYQTTSFVFDDADHAASLFGLKAFGNIYTRIMNPTQAVLEERMAALEGGTAALAVASGHAAQLLVFHTIMSPGDNFIAANRLYGGSINQFGQSFKSFDWHVRWADPPTSQHRGPDRRSTKAIFIESLANPGGTFVTDINAIAEVAQARPAADRRQHHGVSLPDPADRARRRHRGPFADQVHRRPRQLDGRRHRRWRFLRLVEIRQVSRCCPSRAEYGGMVLHETFGNFAFAIACRVLGLRDLGPAISPFNAFMILTGIETLALRMQRHCDNALEVANWLAKHDKVAWVSYAGLPSMRTTPCSSATRPRAAARCSPSA